MLEHKGPQVTKETCVKGNIESIRPDCKTKKCVTGITADMWASETQ